MERDEYRRLYELESELWWFRGMREISETLLARFLPKASGPVDILDAGCGTGGMAVALGERGSVVALDASDDAIRFASRRAGLKLVRGDVAALPFASESFDVVTSFDVIYHLNVRDDEAALAEIGRTLKDEGTVLVRVPAFDRLRSRHDAAVHTRQRYGKRELVERMRRAGLEPVFVTYANCFLFPVAVLRRALESPSSNVGGSEVEPVAPFLNAVLLRVLLLEAKLLRFTPLPFGLSLVAVARRAARDANRS
jgi:SAM-dependent methyltransferase